MFTISFDTDNAAFEDDPAAEIARRLRAVATAVESGRDSGKVIDTNGNTIGTFSNAE